MTSRSRVETLFTAVAIVAIAMLPSGGCNIGVSAKPAAGPGGTAPIKRCRATRPADDGSLDDFEDGNTQLTKSDGRDGYWFTAADPSGSTIEMQTQEPGAGSELAIHMSGKTASGSAEAGQWGVQLGVNFKNEQGVLYDASKYAGISFKAKAAPGSSRNVRFKIGDVNTHKDAGVCTTCWNHFGMDLKLTEGWKEYRIPFSTAEQEPGWGSPRPQSVTPAKLIGFNWSVGPNQAFDMWFDDVTFLDCE